MSDELRKAAQDVVDGFDAGALPPDFYPAGIEALRAALQSCPDCGKPTPEGSVHTCSPQKPDDSIDWEGIAADQAMTIAMLQVEKKCLLEGLLYAVKQVPSLGDVQGIRTQLADAPDSDAVCEWTYIGDGSFDSPCGVDYDCDMVVHPSTYMNFCCGCGKRIRFIDAAMQQEQKK